MQSTSATAMAKAAASSQERSQRQQRAFKRAAARLNLLLCPSLHAPAGASTVLLDAAVFLSAASTCTSVGSSVGATGRRQHGQLTRRFAARCTLACVAMHLAQYT